MKRREFIAALGGAAAAGRSRRARSSERDAAHRRAHACAAGRSGRQARLAAFLQGLQELGWSDGRNMRIDIRWAGGDARTLRKHAAELVALAPDVILAAGGSTVGPAASRRRRTVPIVFASVDRSGRRRLRREPGAAGRQHHRLYAVRIRPEREMAGAAQGDRAQA